MIEIDRILLHLFTNYYSITSVILNGHEYLAISLKIPVVTLPSLHPYSFISFLPTINFNTKHFSTNINSFNSSEIVFKSSPVRIPLKSNPALKRHLTTSGLHWRLVNLPFQSRDRTLTPLLSSQFTLAPCAINISNVATEVDCFSAAKLKALLPSWFRWFTSMLGDVWVSRQRTKEGSILRAVFSTVMRVLFGDSWSRVAPFSNKSWRIFKVRSGFQVAYFKSLTSLGRVWVTLLPSQIKVQTTSKLKGLEKAKYIISRFLPCESRQLTPLCT